LAEIGDFRDFEKPEKLAAWCGLVPSVYQSADKLITGSITKHGSRHIRWILVEVAQVVARCGSPKLKRFFSALRPRKDIMWQLLLLPERSFAFCIICF
jgi:transposase